MKPESTDNSLLAVRELTVTLASDMLAVDRVSFKVRRGECLALVGESGCGKTLTALSLLRAVPPEAGSSSADSLLFEGRELGRLEEREMRRVRGAGIAMVYQDPSSALDPLYTVGAQIVETLRSHTSLDRAAARARCLECLSEAGLDEPERIFSSYPHQLSGGQRQRSVIGMALSCSPRLLIADEPTTALDVTVQARIIALLDSLRRSRGLSLLLITHNLSLVRSLADRVAVMYAGQVVETAKAEDIFGSAAHPYTRALLECLPGLEGGIPKTIPGQVPTPGAWPAGCRFRPRCTMSVQACSGEQDLAPLDRDSLHSVRCHRAAGAGGTGENEYA